MAKTYYKKSKLSLLTAKNEIIITVKSLPEVDKDTQRQLCMVVFIDDGKNVAGNKIK